MNHYQNIREKEAMFFKGYSQTVIEHFMEPHNNYEMTDPSGVGQAGDPSCGDAVGI